MLDARLSRHPLRVSAWPPRGKPAADWWALFPWDQDCLAQALVPAGFQLAFSWPGGGSTLAVAPLLDLRDQLANRRSLGLGPCRGGSGPGSQ